MCFSLRNENNSSLWFGLIQCSVLFTLGRYINLPFIYLSSCAAIVLFAITNREAFLHVYPYCRCYCYYIYFMAWMEIFILLYTFWYDINMHCWQIITAAPIIDPFMLVLEQQRRQVIWQLLQQLYLIVRKRIKCMI